MGVALFVKEKHNTKASSLTEGGISATRDYP